MMPLLISNIDKPLKKAQLISVGKKKEFFIILLYLHLARLLVYHLTPESPSWVLFKQITGDVTYFLGGVKNSFRIIVLVFTLHSFLVLRHFRNCSKQFLKWQEILQVLQGSLPPDTIGFEETKNNVLAAKTTNFEFLKYLKKCKNSLNLAMFGDVAMISFAAFGSIAICALQSPSLLDFIFVKIPCLVVVIHLGIISTRIAVFAAFYFYLVCLTVYL